MEKEKLIAAGITISNPCSLNIDAYCRFNDNRYTPLGYMRCDGIFVDIISHKHLDISLLNNNKILYPKS